MHPSFFWSYTTPFALTERLYSSISLPKSSYVYTSLSKMTLSELFFTSFALSQSFITATLVSGLILRLMMTLGYRELMSALQIHSCRPGIGSLTYAPSNPTPSFKSLSSFLPSTSTFLFGATIFLRRKYVRSAPSRILLDTLNSSYPVWHT